MATNPENIHRSEQSDPDRLHSDSADVDRDISRAPPLAIIGGIVILLIYQGYCLSIVGVASPWIAQSFALDPPALARMFAWMSLSALGSFILSRLADRV